MAANPGDGGGIHSVSDRIIAINSSTVDSNHAEGDGGALLVDGSDVSLDRITVSSNTAATCISLPVGNGLGESTTDASFSASAIRNLTWPL